MHLTDCFVELVAYVVYFRKTVSMKQPPYEQVKADVMRLLSQSEDCVKKGTLLGRTMIRGGLIWAWVDEIILSSAWDQKGKWQREQLQRIFYNTTEAGEEVFERLNSLGLHQREMREVYYLCLALGFKGRYCKQGDEFLARAIKNIQPKIPDGKFRGATFA